MHHHFVEAMLAFPGHLIATMRTKTHWGVETDDKTGKTKPVKIGLRPEQRDGVDYEFTLVLDMNIDGHVASVSKDRTGVLDGKYFTPSVETGNTLTDWLEGGDEPLMESVSTVKSEIKNCWVRWENLNGDTKEWKIILASIGITPGRATRKQLDMLKAAVDDLEEAVRTRISAENEDES